mmetsp:Transcript_29838/g.91581  ORF Transcript_29838/g.91581 Transcript_29838/m.91581 type:complete len:129 (-) Transcript_29838:7-393(-)|eukprot:scaffold30271_cov32-Tisochrysis_lutea.AAC.2
MVEADALKRKIEHDECGLGPTKASVVSVMMLQQCDSWHHAGAQASGQAVHFFTSSPRFVCGPRASKMVNPGDTIIQNAADLPVGRAVVQLCSSAQGGGQYGSRRGGIVDAPLQRPPCATRLYKMKLKF